MSIQLSLIPQFHNGQYNVLSTDPNEFVVNGITFMNLGSAPSVSVGTQPVPASVLFLQPPTIPNSWYLFRTTIGGTPAYPTVSSGKVVLASVVAGAFGSLTGVYQRLSGLTVGQSYTLKVKLTTTSATGNLIIGLYDGTNTVINATVAMSSQTIITYTFAAPSGVATATDNTLWVSFNDTIVNSIEINEISLLPTGTAPTGTAWDLDNGEAICDLYEDEDLPLTLSVDDFKNVAEKVQSYSKAFKLPGTKRNHQIFDNIFEVTRTDDGIAFNPYLKTQCKLKQNGFILFEGYLRLIDVQDKEGEISYNVNLYSEVIALKDVLKEATFSNLDFGELTHNYNKTNIKNSWNNTAPGISYTQPSTSGYRNATDTVKYPFVDWTHQIIIADGFTGSGATLDRPELTDLTQAFRPFIQVKYLIDRIFQATPFTYTSTFFETADFKKLYMDFNWGEEQPGKKGVACGDIKGSTTTFAFLKTQECTGADDPSATDLGWDMSNSQFTCPLNNTTYNINWDFRFNTTVADFVFFKWKLNYAAGGTANIGFNGHTTAASTPFSWSGNFSITLQAGDILIPQYKSNTAGTVAQLASGNVAVSENPKTITSNVMLQALRGELKQWEFLKGIFTMFNLVSLPNEEDKNNIIIETYNDIFLENPNSKEWDWSSKIDVEQIKLKPLTDLNKQTVFKFKEDDDDYAFMAYKKSVFGHLYGSKVWDASGFTILEGTKEIVAEPFAATVPKPLDELFPQLVTPAIYAYNGDDGTTSGFDNSPRIMYNNGIKSSGTTYFIPAFNGLSSENQPDFLQFTHLSQAVPTTATTKDFHFGECQLIQPIGGTPTDNLFNTYWLPYYNELYNPNTRTLTVKVYLNPGDINTFRFWDTVFIKNRSYRVNKIDYKPNDLATVEFILIP